MASTRKKKPTSRSATKKSAVQKKSRTATSNRKTQKKPPATGKVKPRRAAQLIEINDDLIARKAYELWELRGGDADMNWFEAERILRVQLTVGAG